MHARLFLPAIFCLCAPVAVLPVRRRYALAAALLPWVVVCVVTLRPSQRPVGGVVPLAGKVTLQDFGFGKGQKFMAWYTGPGVYVEKAFAFTRVTAPVRVGLPATTVASLAIGRSSYALGDDVYVLDLLGLADPVTAHLRTPLYTTFYPPPGHEKQLPSQWLAARILSPVVTAPPASFPSRPFAPLVDESAGPHWSRQAGDARRVLGCDEVRQLLASGTADLTPGRFLRNLGDSFANTFLRIDPNPSRAVIQLCDQGGH